MATSTAAPSAPSTTAPAASGKPQLPPNIESLLQENKYNLEAYALLIKDAQSKKIEEARPLYEFLVDTFPLSGRFWKLYIEHEMKLGNFERVEKLFQRCLSKLLHIELWRCYLNYIRVSICICYVIMNFKTVLVFSAINCFDIFCNKPQETKGKLASFREKMAKAYDFALDHVGIDNLSYPIWNDYVNFLKNVEACGAYAENQKILATRKVYQKGITNPMANIEAYWKDYIAFERSINLNIAEKFSNERAKEYMNARRVAKEYEVITRGLNRNAPSVPPTGSLEEAKQLEIWRKYINWEKSNPLKLEDEAEVIKRVNYAYEQCLLCFGYHADIYYEYALYLETKGKSLAGETKVDPKKYLEDAANIFERATTGLLKDNILLHFAYADFEEGRNNKTKATKIYDRILSIPSIDPTLIYIQYMKFARRTEGIKLARVIFKRAREDTRSKHQVYIAAALMEYFCQKDKSVACKIFELGLKKFPNEINFILAYIEFLKNLNEENNTRVLFERVLSTTGTNSSGGLENDKLIDIWNKFLEFESNIGDLASITKVEKRRSLAVEKSSKFNNKSETVWLIDRYKFLDLMPCNDAELKAIGYELVSSSSSSSSGLHTNVINGSTCKTSAKTPVTNSAASSAIFSSTFLFGSKKATSSLPQPDVSQMIPFKPSLPHQIRK